MRAPVPGTPYRKPRPELRRSLLVGVSYMIPFVAVGGLLEALGLLFGGPRIAETAAVVARGSLLDLPSSGLAHYLGAVFFTLGSLAFGLIVPVLAGYIGYALADRPGLMPGFTAGLAANLAGAGFLGGVIGGLLAGIVTQRLLRQSGPAWAAGVLSIVFVPLLATLVAGGVMLTLLGHPLALVTTALGTWLTGLGGTSAILLGAVLGAMITADLGGPINKAAYTFAASGLTAVGSGAVTSGTGSGSALSVMAAVMVAGMTAPLALWLATLARPQAFTPEERVHGPAAGALGAFFITEGAIPFAAADPLRVIPALMLGGASAGALTMAAHVTLEAPHGGLVALFAVGHVAMFLIALVLGTLISATAVLLAKRVGPIPAARSSGLVSRLDPGPGSSRETNPVISPAVREGIHKVAVSQGLRPRACSCEPEAQATAEAIRSRPNK